MIGFSCPSTTPYAAGAPNTSGKAIGVGAAPIPSKAAMWTAFLHRAQLESAHVLGRGDGALRVGDMAEAVLGPGETNQIVLADGVEQFLPDLAIEHAAGVVIVAEQERQVDGQNLGDEVCPRGRSR